MADDWHSELSKVQAAPIAGGGHETTQTNGTVSCHRASTSAGGAASAARVEGTQPILTKAVPADLPAGGIAAALSTACMRLHGLHREASSAGGAAAASAWVLVLSSGTTQPRLHSAVVNCAFSAQRMQAPIDVCTLGSMCSVLQQACHVTGGTYSSPTEAQQASLATFLQTVHLVPPALRQSVKQLPQTSVDLRVACTDSGDLLEMAFVCSACLAAYAASKDKCTACGAVYTAKSGTAVV